MTFAMEMALERDHRQMQLRRELPPRPRPELKTVADIKAAVVVVRDKIAAAQASLSEIEAEYQGAAQVLENAKSALAALLQQADTGWPPSKDALISANQAVSNAEIELDLLDRAQKARASLLADEKAELFGLAKAFAWVILRDEQGEAKQVRNKRIELEEDEQKRIYRTMAARSDYEGITTLRDAHFALQRYGL